MALKRTNQASKSTSSKSQSAKAEKRQAAKDAEPPAAPPPAPPVPAPPNRRLLAAAALVVALASAASEWPVYM